MGISQKLVFSTRCIPTLQTYTMRELRRHTTTYLDCVLCCSLSAAQLGKRAPPSFLPSPIARQVRCTGIYNTAEGGGGGVHPPAPPTLPVLPKRYIVCLLFLFYSYLSPPLLFIFFSFLILHFLNVLASGLFPRLLYTRAIPMHTTHIY